MSSRYRKDSVELGIRGCLGSIPTGGNILSLDFFHASDVNIAIIANFVNLRKTRFLIFLQIGNAVRLDASQRQWIDLGIHTEVCLTRPDRCTIGGAVSFWIKLIGTETYTGLLSTKESSGDIRVFTVVKTFNHIE